MGGLLNSVRIHDICAANGIGNWAGGMIETGIGQRFKIAISTLPNFKYAADIETSDRFLVEDLVTPDIAHIKGMLDANTDYKVDEVSSTVHRGHHNMQSLADERANRIP